MSVAVNKPVENRPVELDDHLPQWAAPGVPAWPDTDRVVASGCVDLAVPARFQGPDGMGNGGWVAGSLASLMPAGPVEVTLRAPTPLDVPLHCEWSGYGARLFAPSAGGVLANAVSASEPPEAPPFVRLTLAQRAAQRFAGHGYSAGHSDGHGAGGGAHPFPRCVVCGPERSLGDGMRIFPGRVDGSPDLVAAPWTVAPSLAGPGVGGRVPAAVVWGALDCPTGWALYTPGTVALLGRLAVSVVGEVIAGRTYVVVARAQGRQGRKAFAHAALYDLAGGLVASSRATWVSIG